MKNLEFKQNGKVYNFSVSYIDATEGPQFHIFNQSRSLDFINQDTVIFYRRNGELTSNIVDQSEVKDFIDFMFKEVIEWSEEMGFELLPV